MDFSTVNSQIEVEKQYFRDHLPVQSHWGKELLNGTKYKKILLLQNSFDDNLVSYACSTVERYKVRILRTDGRMLTLPISKNLIEI